MTCFRKYLVNDVSELGPTVYQLAIDSFLGENRQRLKPLLIFVGFYGATESRALSNYFGGIQ